MASEMLNGQCLVRGISGPTQNLHMAERKLLVSHYCFGWDREETLASWYLREKYTLGQVISWPRSIGLDSNESCQLGFRPLHKLGANFEKVVIKWRLNF